MASQLSSTQTNTLIYLFIWIVITAINRVPLESSSISFQIREAISVDSFKSKLKTNLFASVCAYDNKTFEILKALLVQPVFPYAPTSLSGQKQLQSIGFLLLSNAWIVSRSAALAGVWGVWVLTEKLSRIYGARRGPNFSATTDIDSRQLLDNEADYI